MITVITVAVGFASREYTASESDESVILYIIKQGQVKKKVDIHYEIKPAHNHPPNGISDLFITFVHTCYYCIPEAIKL